MSRPLMSALTANARIAPNARRKMLPPMPIGPSLVMPPEEGGMVDRSRTSMSVFTPAAESVIRQAEAHDRADPRAPAARQGRDSGYEERLRSTTHQEGRGGRGRGRRLAGRRGHRAAAGAVLVSRAHPADVAGRRGGTHTGNAR